MIPSGRLALLAACGLVFALGLALEKLLGGGSAFELPLALWNAAVAGVALADLALGLRAAVEVERSVPPVLSVGRSNPVSLTLRSRLGRAVVARVHDDGAQDVVAEGVPCDVALAPGRTATLRYHLRPTRRGAHVLGDVLVRIPSPLGLWCRQRRLAASRPVRVYPDLQAVRLWQRLVREAREEAFTRSTRRRGGENEFERLREYTPDDDVRHIDWKATARRRTVIAREFQLERNQNLMFLLDLGRLMTAQSGGLSHLDHALNATLMLGHVGVRTGDHVGLAAFDSALRTFVPPAGGPRALHRLIQTSYDLFPSLVEPDYREVFSTLKLRLRKRSLLVLFTQVLDSAARDRLVPLVRSLSPTHLPLCVLFRDESVEALMRPEPTGAVELCTRGAAAGELLWRERVVEEMRRAGALVLHVRPAELTQQLISRYLEIKARRLL